MKCMKCGHETFISTNTEAFELGGGRLLVVRNIPCHKCRECDEILYTGDVVEQLEAITASASQQMQQLTVIDFTQAA